MAKMIKEITKVTSCLWCPFNQRKHWKFDERYCKKFSLNIKNENIIHPGCKLEDWPEEEERKKTTNGQ